MRTNAKEDAEELVKEYYGNCTDFIDSNKEAKEAAIIFAIKNIEARIEEASFYDYGHPILVSTRIKYFNEMLKELEEL